MDGIGVNDDRPAAPGDAFQEMENLFFLPRPEITGCVECDVGELREVETIESFDERCELVLTQGRKLDGMDAAAMQHGEAEAEIGVGQGAGREADGSY